MNTIFTASACLVFLSASAFAAAFTPGDIVVDQVGTGGSSLTSAATAVFLDEYSTAGSPVQSIALPTAGGGSEHAYTQSGSATSEGQITLSPNGEFLTMMGYSATPGTSGVSSSTSSSDPRTVAIINAAGSIDTTTALTDAASGNNPRTAVTTDGTSIWVAGAASGIRYTTDGSSTSTELNSTDTNFETIGIYGGQLYASSQKASIDIATIGTGLPTTSGQTITNLSGLPTSDFSYGFSFVDLNGSTTPNALYVSDSSAGIEKYTLSAGTWSLKGTVSVPGTGVTGLTAELEGGTVDLYFTTPTNIYSLADSSGLSGSLSGTPDSIATAATNEAFRGIAFAPEAVPEPSTWATVLCGFAALIGFRTRRNRSRRAR